MIRFLKIYLLPGAILQSVMIGGGYGTGRELVEFFTRFGIANGFLGQLLATLLVSGIFAITLALAVQYQTYDYRSFFKLILGRAWFLFEALLDVSGHSVPLELHRRLPGYPERVAARLYDVRRPGSALSVRLLHRRAVRHLHRNWSRQHSGLHRAHRLTVGLYGLSR